MKYTIGFSPCPNDTFIFDALVNHKMDTGDIEFEPVLEDVQTLNEWAIAGKLDITKISYGVLPLLLNQYKLLPSGSALGKGVGPLLIAKEAISQAELVNYPVAIPGEFTTAHLLFSLKYPQAKNKVFLRYDQVENFVVEGKGLGVIIHENRFTYASRGLVKITDLGDYWEQKMNIPIPLGGIVVKRSLPDETQNAIATLIAESLSHSYSHYPVLSEYVKEHAQEMEEDVMRKHIDLYVNDFSTSLGKQGEAAVMELIKVYAGQHGVTFQMDDLFVR